MRKFIQSLARDQRGVSALEYAILAGIIAVTIGAGITMFADKISDAFDDLGTTVTEATKP
jgi:pilus assembly protein Flp/PilA